MSDSDDENPVKTIKMVLLGDTNTGKTSIIRRYCFDEFTRQYTPTSGADFYLHHLKLRGNVEIIIRFTDVAGTELDRKMLENYLFQANIICLIYDITNLQTFNSLQLWLTKIQNLIIKMDTNIKIVIIANKSDLEHRRAVNLDLINQFCEQNYFKHHKLSAKTNEHLHQIINNLVIQQCSDKQLIEQSPQKCGDDKDENHLIRQTKKVYTKRVCVLQ